jgi:site-specific DNA-methyltransferase (adenine-specific)
MREPFYADSLTTLYHGDCLDVMAELEPASFDAVICDPPYGTTNCAWDSVIPFGPMWAALRRLVKPRAAIALFGSQPFTSALVMSNPGWFKYQWIWEKTNAVDFALANIRPRKLHEEIVVFSQGAHNYYPQMARGAPYIDKPRKRTNNIHGSTMPNLGIVNDGVRYPSSIIREGNGNNGNCHPTQKPLALMEYLVRTYTNGGDRVLDFTAGSGTTLRAAKNLRRSSVGIEQDRHYCDVTVKRLAPTFEQAIVDNGASLDALPLFAQEVAE